MPLNNQYVNEIKEEIKKYFERDEDENNCSKIFGMQQKQF